MSEDRKVCEYTYHPLSVKHINQLTGFAQGERRRKEYVVTEEQRTVGLLCPSTCARVLHQRLVCTQKPLTDYLEHSQSNLDIHEKHDVLWNL